MAYTEDGDEAPRLAKFMHLTTGAIQWWFIITAILVLFLCLADMFFFVVVGHSVFLDWSTPIRGFLAFIYSIIAVAISFAMGGIRDALEMCPIALPKKMRQELE